MKYQVVHTFGNVIHQGTKHECDVVIKALTTYGVNDSKFDVIEVPEIKALTDKTREEIREMIAQCIEQGSFGDGLERDYAWDGCVIVGANEYSDEELVEELLNMGYDEDDDLYQQAKGELILEEMLATGEIKDE